MPPRNRVAATAPNAAPKKATKTKGAPAKTQRSSATSNAAPTSNGRGAVKETTHDESDDGEEDESAEQDESVEQEQNHDDPETKRRKYHEEANGGRRLDRRATPAAAAGSSTRSAPRGRRAAGKVAAAALVDESNHAGESDRRRGPRSPKVATRPSKRKRDVEDEDKAEEEDEEPEQVPKPKKPRAAPAAPKKAKAKAKEPKPAPVPKPAVSGTSSATKSRPERAAPRMRGPGAKGVPFNEVPSKELDVFVFGEGSSGELGLGSKKYDGKKPIDVKRPRLNHNLKGVVALACGGMHCIALTHDQKILTWGVNDDKALGRNTFWEGGTRDVNDEESDDEDDDDTGINPNESTPGEVDISILPEGTKIAQVAASDSASFILTDDGWVYGWGTFRGADGIIGFSEHVRIQETPALIPGLKNITKLVCGANHVLALDLSGKVFTWGSGGQLQLGRKPVSRLLGPSAGLHPQPCGKFTKKHHAINVGAGSYHSFYVDNDDQVWAWGLNNYAQTGLRERTGEDEAMILHPELVQSLQDHKVTQIVGGEHHSVACTTEGKLLTWGRVDGHQVGQPSDIYDDSNAIFDDNKKPRILLQPTVIDGIKASFVATGTDTSFVINHEGKVYSWGFSANYQTGQGSTDDVLEPTLIDNTAIRDRKIVWAGAGGQYSVVAAGKDDEVPNGH
ncbi:hypothetical protein K445DRAFT_321370 [Daldinia sp. EC12]|nr:hypothetical protein K445DRAFT_321370 [Daldinia sp. EC12]